MSHGEAYASSTLQFPKQKKKTSAKSRKWAKECIDAAEQMVLYDNEGIRRSYFNKRTNYDLANGFLDQNDIERAVNPFGLSISEDTAPAKMQHYPVANPKIDLLIGEEFKRKFDYKIVTANWNAVSEKEEQKVEEWRKKIRELIKQEHDDPQEIKRELQEMKQYMDYDFQDIRERRASQLMAHHEKEQRFDITFNNGFHDALIAGEEIYKVDIVSGEPVLEKCSPLNIHTLRSGESPHIEDADMIIEDGYKSPGEVIDEFYEHLTDKQIKEIEEGHTANTDSDFISIGEKEPNIILDEGYLPQSDDPSSGIARVTATGARAFGGDFDENGNIRTLRVLWKSLRNVKELKYFDEDGEEQYDIVDENYEPDNSQGEEITNEYWINEWWEGTRIGRDIYVKIQPRPIQFRSMDNISKCRPGYIGTAYNIDNSHAMSLMDRMRPFQYMYDIIMYRTELALAKSKGKIAQLDLSKIPSGMSIHEWMHYAETMGVAIVDSFKEGTKGRARGQLAGNVNNTLGGNVLDTEMNQYIQQNIQMLEFIDQRLGEISGVSDERQGQISQSALVGNTERSVTQSAHITQKWFTAHDDVKKRAVRDFLETAKAAYRGRSKKIQYVSDDLSTQLYEIDGDEFADQEYGVFVSNATADMELLQTMKQLAQSGLQNDKINFSQLIDIYSSESMSTMRNKIEEAEKRKEQQEAQAQKQQMKQQQADREFEKKKFIMDTELRKKELEQNSVERAKDRQHDLTLKDQELTQEDKHKDQEHSLEEQKHEDEHKISLEELKQQEQELQKTIEQKEKELDLQEEQHEDETELQKRELDIKEMEAKNDDDDNDEDDR